VRGIDDMVGQVVAALSANGQLDNTYVFVTSDNGYHLGQHRMPPGKYTPYEPDIRLPLFVRGPGVPAGGTSAELTSNIDLAPTLVDLAGGHAPSFVDGVSFAPWLTASPPNGQLRRTLLLERKISTFVGGPLARGRMDLGEPRDPRLLEQLDFQATPYRGVRSADGFTYVLYADGQEELYDLHADPYQLRNLLARGKSVSGATFQRLRALRRDLSELTGCSGASCHQ
jgi:N-acetylglucosamine-6-sulfatase